MKIVFSAFLVTVTLYTQGQYYLPRKIVSNKEFIHKTGLLFPRTFGKLDKREITSYDVRKLHISVRYRDKNNTTVITIFVYPNNSTNENRLKNEFMDAVYAIEEKSYLFSEADKYPLVYENDGIKTVGLTAALKDAVSQMQYLFLFECGKWMLKFRISTDGTDTTGFSSMKNALLKTFPPSQLVKKSPFNPEMTPVIDKSVLQDTVLTQLVLLALHAKTSWVEEHVDSIQRCAGFPGLYLEEHVVPLKIILAAMEDKPLPKDDFTLTYISDLRKLSDNNFLSEFVMDQYDNLLVVPPERRLNTLQYNSWKELNPIHIYNHKPLYLMVYKNK